MKRPDLLIVNEATAVLDAAAQSRIAAQVLAARAGHGVVWVQGRAETTQKFDRIVVMEDGRIVEQGTSADLDPAAE